MITALIDHTVTLIFNHTRDRYSLHNIVMKLIKIKSSQKMLVEKKL